MTAIADSPRSIKTSWSLSRFQNAVHVLLVLAAATTATATLATLGSYSPAGYWLPQDFGSSVELVFDLGAAFLCLVLAMMFAWNDFRLMRILGGVALAMNAWAAVTLSDYALDGLRGIPGYVPWMQAGKLSMALTIGGALLSAVAAALLASAAVVMIIQHRRELA
jgi:hypothetical protein